MHETVKKKAKRIPPQPGVYLFKNRSGRVIYVGKAKNLKLRLRSYLQETGSFDPKRTRLNDSAVDLETILVDNEKEALALENNLIKRFQPRYNILLRDDKTYPYIKLTIKERFPRVYVTRRLRKDGSLYFGPYFPARLAYRITDLIHRHFLIPSCTVDLTRYHPRPCLQYHIKRCLGPCVEGLTTPDRYTEAARDVRLLLEGRRQDLMRSLRERMDTASRAQYFEQAAHYRDLVATIRQISERQKLAASSGYDIDIFGFFQEGPLAALNLFHMRGGRVVDRREFFWEDLEITKLDEFFSSLLKLCYLNQQYIPQAIHVPVDFEDRSILEEILTEKRGGKVTINSPKRGQKRALLKLVARNAQHSFERRFRVHTPSPQQISKALAEALNLERAPRRIECFDVSHLQGSDTVASLVVWENGRMKKSDYRKFLVRNAQPKDDYSSLREVVLRRYQRLQKEQKLLPDLILIDGGVGQLRAAAGALESLQIINQPLACIAKRKESIFVLGHEQEPIQLDCHSPLLLLIQKIRDETHNFAVNFHRQRRSHRNFHTELLTIPRVGLKTAQKLLRSFKSLESLRHLSVTQISQVVSKKQATSIYSHFRKHFKS